ncbi:MAG: type III-A CRISPR-associated protein Csm2 [Anaerolineae bacterium]|nr:type III-A CRISPR-associated protein Csm2 [Anaerolineae bacterium]
MSQHRSEASAIARPSDAELRTIITDPNGAETLVKCADNLGRYLKEAGLTTSQIRSLFGEVRQIQAEWSIESRRDHARRRLILLKPKMAYRARKERGRAVEELVSVLRPALDLVTRASGEEQDGNFQRFVEFFEAILAYHKAYGGN